MTLRHIAQSGSCAGCGKPLKREEICKHCRTLPWHEVNRAYEKYAVIFFKRSERFLRYVLTEKYYPLWWYGEEYTDEITEITEEDRQWELKNRGPLSVDEVTFEEAYRCKRNIEFHRYFRRKNLREWNIERESDNKKCPKCSNMKRTCRICHERKPLDYNHFYYGRGYRRVNDRGRTYNDLEKKQYLGYVCRECFKKQQEAMKELKKIGVNIGGFHRFNIYKHSEKMMFLSMGRTLAKAKKIIKERKNEPDHKHVQREQ